MKSGTSMDSLALLKDSLHRKQTEKTVFFTFFHLFLKKNLPTPQKSQLFTDLSYMFAVERKSFGEFFECFTAGKIIFTASQEKFAASQEKFAAGKEKQNLSRIRSRIFSHLLLTDRFIFRNDRHILLWFALILLRDNEAK